MTLEQPLGRRNLLRGQLRRPPCQRGGSGHASGSARTGVLTRRDGPRVDERDVPRGALDADPDTGHGFAIDVGFAERRQPVSV